ncbi:nucleoside monophosphate kinase [Buchnera aphidicola (Ceratoglyphina bambusae)]|uniref:adenylate kinase family protein n=1 Tax=Buchnera aphidicola TaxID=9 RepID=UPI0031B8A541
MKIILLGAPGSGKGTQSKFISNKYNIKKISVGEIFRKNLKKNDNIKKKIDNGELIEDKIVVKLIKKRILQKDCSNGYLLDGFPRTLEQAKNVYLKNIKIDYIIEFLVDDNILLKRISGRLIHEKSGRTYHKIFSPPIIKNKDNITGENLKKRKDDKINIAKSRLLKYKIEIKKIRKYFMKKFKKKYYKINGNFDENKTMEKILKIIK